MHRVTQTLLTAALLGLASFAPLSADELSDSQSRAKATHEAGRSSQSRIDRMDADSREALAEYQNNERLADITEAYNQQIARLVESQERELADLKTQLDSIEETDQAVLPMLNRMVETLGKFVAADLPFLEQERQQRLQRLQQLLLRADVSIAEKYRQILEAYLVEVQYGRTLEAYSGRLEQAGRSRQVNFLRLGRTALYYQTLGGQESGLWQPSEQRWQVLTTEQGLKLRQAIQVARQQQVPSLLELPLPSPES